MSPFGRHEEPRSERSEEERERARQEREARRAGRPPSAPPQPQAAELPAPEPPPPPTSQPIFDPEPEPGTDGEDVGPPRAVTNVRPVGAQETDEHDEIPIGTKRVRAGSPLATAAGAGPPPREHQRGIPRRRGAARILAVVTLLAAFVFAWFLYSLIQPGHGDGGERVRVVIPDGLSASQVADLLEARGIVGSSFFFSLRARLAGKREQLQSGTFQLRRDMGYGAAIDALTTARPPPATIKVTIPEGRSARETAPLVRQAGLEGSYLAATRSESRARNLGAPRGTSTLEGFLFPATYELDPDASARRLVRDQLLAFRENIAQVDMRRARAKNLTRYDVLIIASMIEREAGVARDRRLISAVIYNRLKQRMPLGIDATIRYRLGNWSRPLRVSELETDSDFNTRRRLGLPPTPIGNPGLASLKAAADPAKVGYIYYVVKPCGNGAHAFSSSDAEFQRDVAAYNRARDQRGGNDPSRC